EPVQYEPMPAGGFPGHPPSTELSTSTFSATTKYYKAALPWTFNFYGQPYDSMEVYPHGFVTFGEMNRDTFEPGSPTVSNTFWNANWSLEHPEAPVNAIAMWAWTLICNNTVAHGRVSTQVLGTAPHRKFVL